MAVPRFVFLCLCVCVSLQFQTSAQPVNFQLPPLPDLPSPGDVFNKMQKDFEGMRNDFNKFKAQMDEMLELPPFDYEAFEEVKVALDEFMNGPNCFKIPHEKEDPQVHMTSCEMVKYLGYPCEVHEVVTKDNYILGVHRIPYGKGMSAGPRPVAFLQHGLLDSSATWVSNNANQSLGFLLADAGYDVWMGNMRGNTYSKGHTKLDPTKDKLYWEFSWDEMARSDLPSMIEHALHVTGQPKLYYIGHSQGTMIAFARFSEDQKLADKVEYFVALGPVSTVASIKSPVRLLAPFLKHIQFLYYGLGEKGEFLSSSPLIRWIAQNICRNPIGVACENVLFLIAGFDCTDLNVTRVPVYVSHTPAGTSVQNIIHYAQQVQSKKFVAYDYGKKGNLKHYNQTTPPEYHPENLKIPVALYWGGKDWLADPKDVELLIKKLVHIDHNQYIPSFDHLDFVWGTSATELVYQDVIAVMKKHPIEVVVGGNQDHDPRKHEGL